VIVDAHVHAFPPEVVADRAGFLDGEPAFQLLYADPLGRLVEAAELIESLDRDGVAQAVVCGFPWRDPGRARLHNDCLLAAAREYPGRLIPLAGVDPLGPGALAEAERALAAGAAGLGEIGAYLTDLDEPEVLKGLIALARLSAEAGRPLLLHANEPVGHDYPGKSPMSLRGLYRLLQACPETRFQLAHLGGGLFFFELLKREVGQVLANCVYDTAAAPFLYKPGLYSLFSRLAGPERLLYGSDFPLLGLSRYLKDMAAAELEDRDRERILGLNAAAFWNLI